MKVYAFDRDGTVSTSNGPVPIEWVKELKKDHEVYAIGNQRLKREAGIPGRGELNAGGRRDCLYKLKEKFPDADRYIVVDDRDLSDMEQKGWEYYTPKEFKQQWANDIGDKS